ncbi:hypothetical protein J4455_01420 [Candidatus Woesearchaeota archaeon]|nr:hypothetical protein [Candidatus Woesearchaeota archaeon]
MATLEKNIWQEASSLLKGELENAIRNLANDLETTKDPEKREKIARVILLADYLRKRETGEILDRENYNEIMNMLNIKNGNTMRNYLQELRDKAKSYQT